MRSFLDFPPWMAFMYRAWPSTKGMPWASKRSASQYQANIHSTPTTSPSRNGAMASRKAAGPAGRFFSKRLALVIEDVQEQAPCVQVAAGVKSVLLIVKSHGHGLLRDGPP